jgi:hypothetical protein
MFKKREAARTISTIQASIDRVQAANEAPPELTKPQRVGLGCSDARGAIAVLCGLFSTHAERLGLRSVDTEPGSFVVGDLHEFHELVDVGLKQQIKERGSEKWMTMGRDAFRTWMRHLGCTCSVCGDEALLSVYTLHLPVLEV